MQSSQLRRPTKPSTTAAPSREQLRCRAAATLSASPEKAEADKPKKVRPRAAEEQPS